MSKTIFFLLCFRIIKTCKFVIELKSIGYCQRIRALPAHRQFINANSDRAYVFSLILFFSLHFFLLHHFGLYHLWILVLCYALCFAMQCEMETHVASAYAYIKSYILKMLFVELMKCSWKWRMKHLKFVLIIYSTRCTHLYCVCFNFYLGSLSLNKTVAKSNLMRCAHDDDVVVVVVVDDER